MASTLRVATIPLLSLTLLLPLACGTSEDGFDLVILGGRVIDPDTEMDDVRHLGIRDGVIKTVSQEPLLGKDTIDAQGLVVVPGFIDVHGHGQDDANYRARVKDGVTTALELELGTGDVPSFYKQREGTSLIHHGASSGHVPIRILVMGDEGARLPIGPAANDATGPEEAQRILGRIRAGLEAGAPAVGFSLQNTPAAGREEVKGAFALAAEFGVPVHVHLRHMGPVGDETSLTALEEVLELSRVTGAGIHVAHIHSSGLAQTETLLQRISEAHRSGTKVSTEFYPYTAGQTNIEGAFFSGDWRHRLDIDYGDLEWPATGERLTEETYERYRAEGGLVIIHMIPLSALAAAIRHPLAMVASDGLIVNGHGHPRASGSYSRILGTHVRDQGAISLSEAIRKMSLLPAQRLEPGVPAMGRKGRIQPGMDADIVVFDYESVSDRATYEEPTLPPEGIHHVLVAGVPVVRGGKLDDSRFPGVGIRTERQR